MAFPTIPTSATTTQAAATSIAANMPASVATGDLLIAEIATVLAATITPPAGWTIIGAATSDGNSANTLAAYQRIADGSEGATQTWSFGSTVDSVALVHRITGYDTTLPVNLTGSTRTSATSGSTTAINAPAGNATFRDSLIIRACATREATSIADPSGQTALSNASTGTAATNSSARACYTTQAAATGCPQVSFVASGASREWVAATIVINGIPNPTYGVYYDLFPKQPPRP